MKTFVAGAAIALVATAADAGRLDRSGQGIAPIFEEGGYAELSFGIVSPNVSGTAVAGLGGASSGDMAGRYVQTGLAVKQSVGDAWDFGVIFDQPFGANTDYPTGTGYYAQGATAKLTTTAVTAIGRYTMPSNFSLHGGLRYQTLEATAAVPFVGGYTANAKNDGGVGWLAGVAYEKPEIALRVALTYNSAVTHKVATTEGGPVPGTSVTTIKTPQSVNLDFQTGIAEGTLLFGSVRWVDWSAFDITPIGYFTATGGSSLVSYSDDTITYTAGVGRRLSDAWAAALTFSHEPKSGGFSSNLGPTDGATSVGAGVTYTQGNMKISGGVRYVWVGDTKTQIPGFAPAGRFKDNTAVGAGVKVAFSF